MQYEISARGTWAHPKPDGPRRSARRIPRSANDGRRAQAQNQGKEAGADSLWARCRVNRGATTCETGSPGGGDVRQAP